jgi:hypothetical protein
MRHLQFFFKIRQHSQSAQQHARTDRMSVSNCQTIKAIYFDLGQMRRRRADLLEALLDGE